MIGPSFSQNNSAAVAQAWVKSELLKNGAVGWRNDTAFAAAIREGFIFTPKFWEQATQGTTKIPMVQAHFRFSRQAMSDTTLPFWFEVKTSCPVSLLTTPVTSRLAFNDALTLFTALTNTPAEVDDFLAARAHLA